MARNPFQSYKDTQIGTARQGQLILMMYDGAIGFLQQAALKMEKGDIEGKGMFLNKAIGVISGLNTAVDEDKGGEIATNLRSLYFFMNRHLTEANMKNDVKKIEDVINLLKVLRDAWTKVLPKVSEGEAIEVESEDINNPRLNNEIMSAPTAA